MLMDVDLSDRTVTILPLHEAPKVADWLVVLEHHGLPPTCRELLPSPLHAPGDCYCLSDGHDHCQTLHSANVLDSRRVRLPSAR
jgi:hypothetical protein